MTALLVDTERREAQFWNPNSGRTSRPVPGAPGTFHTVNTHDLLAAPPTREMWRGADLRYVRTNCDRGIQSRIEPHSDNDDNRPPMSGLCAAITLLFYAVCLRANTVDLCAVNAALLSWVGEFERANGLPRLRLALALWYAQCQKAPSHARMLSWVGLTRVPAYGDLPDRCGMCQRDPGRGPFAAAASRPHGDGDRCDTVRMPGWTVCERHRTACVVEDTAIEKPPRVRTPRYEFVRTDDYEAGQPIQPLYDGESEDERAAAFWRTNVAYPRLPVVKREAAATPPSTPPPPPPPPVKRPRVGPDP